MKMKYKNLKNLKITNKMENGVEINNSMNSQQNIQFINYNETEEKKQDKSKMKKFNLNKFFHLIINRIKRNFSNKIFKKMKKIIFWMFLVKLQLIFQTDVFYLQENSIKWKKRQSKIMLN